MKKLLSVVVVLAMMLTVGAVSVQARDISYNDTLATGIIAEFKGSDFNNAAEDTTDAEAGTIDLLENSGRDLWGLYLVDTPANTVLKVAYYLTVEEDQDFSGEIKFRPAREVYCNFPMADLFADENTGKVIVVVPFNAYERPEGLLWYSESVEATVDKVVFAAADYNFANDPEYTLIAEQVANAGSEMANGTPAEGSWTPSVANDGEGEGSGEGEGTGEGEGSGSGDVTVPETGDVSVMLAVLTAGAAAFGGLKLRKR